MIVRAALLAGAVCVAAGAGAAEITLSAAWMRPASAGSDARAYVDIASDTPVTLVGASSPAARRVQVMVVATTDGIDPGTPARALPVVPGAATRLAYKGNYLRLAGLRRSAVNGNPVPVTLEFRDGAGKRRTARADIQVRGLVLPAAPERPADPPAPRP